MAEQDLWATLRATEIPLFEGVAPGSEGWTHQEGESYTEGGLRVVRNVVQPSLTPFLPKEPTGTAVVVAPGGAFHFLAWDHEGIQVARWLQARGIAAFVFKYRLVPTDDTFPADVNAHMAEPDPMRWMAPLLPLIRADAQQAIRLVRNRANEWGIHPQRIGIMGFSAGGAVTALATMQYDATSRPDFGAPIYGAAIPGEVPPDAPPIFIACAQDDDLLPHSLDLFNRWHAAGREPEMHIYARGGHGFGMNKTGLPSESWIERFYDWLRMLGY